MRGGQEISRYYFGKDLYRPFLYPLIGPSGKSLMRMGYLCDANGHSHHNSLWVSHHVVDGVGFWNDSKSSEGRIVHQKVLRQTKTPTMKRSSKSNAWVDGAGCGKTLLEEKRTMRFRPQADGQWLLVLDISFSAPKQAVTLGKTNFGFTGVRMAKTIGVNDGGGMIRNSEGAINEPQVHEQAGPLVRLFGPDDQLSRRRDHALRSSAKPEPPHNLPALPTTAGWGSVRTSPSPGRSSRQAANAPLRLLGSCGRAHARRH